MFRPEMKVTDALALHPSVRWVFAAYHIKGCADCPAAEIETLEEVAEGYKLPLQRLLDDLNSLLPSS